MRRFRMAVRGRRMFLTLGVIAFRVVLSRSPMGLGCVLVVFSGLGMGFLRHCASSCVAVQAKLTTRRSQLFLKPNWVLIPIGRRRQPQAAIPTSAVACRYGEAQLAA